MLCPCPQGNDSLFFIKINHPRNHECVVGVIKWEKNQLRVDLSYEVKYYCWKGERSLRQNNRFLDSNEREELYSLSPGLWSSNSRPLRRTRGQSTCNKETYSFWAELVSCSLLTCACDGLPCLETFFRPLGASNNRKTDFNYGTPDVLIFLSYQGLLVADLSSLERLLINGCSVWLRLETLRWEMFNIVASVPFLLLDENSTPNGCLIHFNSNYKQRDHSDFISMPKLPLALFVFSLLVSVLLFVKSFVWGR